MPRIRTIKPEFWTSEQIVECSTNARLLFVGLWCFCDDQGVHPASTKRLRMEVFPGDLFSDDQVREWVEELKANGLLQEFESEGEKYWHVTGFSKHQTIKKPTFRYPSPPPTNSGTGSPPVPNSGTPPVPNQYPTATPRNGMERKGNIKKTSSSSCDDEPSLRNRLRKTASLPSTCSPVFAGRIRVQATEPRQLG